MNNKKTSALQFPQICIVEASAGSGKTYALAKRFVSLLINSYLKPEEIPLNTILAITFTNKAALEMKERILEFLKKIALNKFENDGERRDILSCLAVEEEFARNKAYRIMDYLLKNYNFFQVQTIDSFINAILYGCAFKLELSAGFKTEKDYIEYLVYSFDKVIDRASSDKNILRLFQRFLRQYLYIENKTGWFPKQTILSIIVSLFSEGNKYHGTFIRNNTEAEDLIREKRNALKLMHELQEQLPSGTHKNFINNLLSFLEQNREGFALDNLSDFFKREEFPITKDNPVSPQVRKLWDSIRKDISELCEQESASMFNYYVEIFNRVLEELKSVSSRKDVLFLESLNKQARRLFDEGALGLPELYYRLATRFRHFLIDEFQDTSVLQWENLFTMVEEALSTEGSLFYVGDRKQAIYRFRGGEVSLINTVKERFREFNLNSQSLNKNYRSQKEIVEFNNLIFSEDNLRRFLKQKQDLQKAKIGFNSSDIDEIVEVFHDSKQSYRQDKPGGYVKAESVDYQNTEERNELLREKLLELIDDLRKRFLLKEITLLARKNNEVERLTSWLLEKGIPVESEKTLNIRENSYIKEMVSLLKFLNSPIDNLSFASFILGDIFCQASGLDREKVQDFIFKLHCKRNKEAIPYLYREFRQEFPEVWDEFIEEFFKNVGFVPLYELMISLLNKFKVLRSFPLHQGFFMKFLELLREWEEERTSIQSFLEFFEKAPQEELYVNVTETDAIKILTIHKSKGLEFGVVVIPFLEMNVKTDSMVVAVDDSELKLIYLKKKYGEFSPRLAELWKQEYKKSFIDELNSIYVAFTRAEDELYIFVSSRAQKGFNPASLLLPDNNLERGEKTKYKAKNNKEEFLTVEIPPSEYKDWIHLLKDEFIDESILQSREKIKKGEVLHWILSFIGNLHGQDKDLVVKQAIEKTGRQFPYIDDFREYELVINKLLADKKLKSYFEIEGAKIYLEKEIVDSYGNTKRIDRLIVKPDEARIVDYKSSRDNNSDYHKQVAEYMKIIQGIYPQLKVKGFLIYLDDLGLEEIIDG